MISRREGFIGLLASVATSARAQPLGRMRRIGILFSTSRDSDAPLNLEALLQALDALGWIAGRTAKFETRWGGGSQAELLKHAMEMVALRCDVILVSGTAAVAPALQATRLDPIVFVNVTDPVGTGFVESLARPGGNATGFTQFEYTLSGKWPELLKQAVPTIARIAVIRDPALPSGIGQLAVIQSVAPALGIDISVINLRDAAQIARDITKFAQLANGGLIVTASAAAVGHADLIAGMALQHRQPAIAYRKYFASRGTLLSYGYDIVDQHRRAATYIDRILKGEKPSDLPVQSPTGYELVINMRTAKTLGLTMPSLLVAQADEVIE